MSSLADLPELIGFFSYSREDDADSHGALSALRTRIQGELRGQLGRTAKTFRLWQDKEAIPSGTLWENEITTAATQSVFFIPIITPTVIASPYCKFELDAFLAREAALGRDDLVFPILYIDVPTLADSVQVQHDPVIAFIAKRQYMDWRKLRHRDVRATDVGEAIEQFCLHIRNALRRPWISPEARAAQEAEVKRRDEEARRIEAEAEQRRIAEAEERRRQKEQAEAAALATEAERQRQEAEAKRRDEEARRIEAEAEVRRRQEEADAVVRAAEAERQRQEAEAKRRDEEARRIEAEAEQRRIAEFEVKRRQKEQAEAASWAAEAEAKRHGEEARRQFQHSRARPPWWPALIAASSVGLALFFGIDTWLSAPTPLSAAQEQALKPRDTFQECGRCPRMVVVQSGSFSMGSANEPGRADEGPPQPVTLARPFAVGRSAVTVDQFAAFVRETGYAAGLMCWTFENGRWANSSGRSWRYPGFAQTGSHPAVCLSWNDAKAYVTWLSKKTGKTYRLLSEAEYEYATRAWTASVPATRYFFGDDEASMCLYGNGLDQTAQKTVPGAVGWTALPCNDGYAYTAPVASFLPNAFGLYDMHGNVSSWTEDCYHDNLRGTRPDGTAFTAADCNYRVIRGGAWDSGPRDLRSASRSKGGTDYYNFSYGVRVGRTLSTP